MKNFKRFFIKLISRVFSLLPRTFLFSLSGATSKFLWRVVRFRRFTILKNLHRVFPSAQLPELSARAERSLAYFLFHFFEIVRIPAMTGPVVEREIIYEGMSNFESAFAQGKGVLILSLHLGAGDRAIAAMSMRGYRMNVITKRFRGWFANSVWFPLRGHQGTEYIEAHDKKNAFHILKTLKRRGVIVFVMDQFMGKPYGIEVPFFGYQTGTAIGLAVFAEKTRAPVVPMWTYTDENLCTHVCAGTPLAPEKIAEGLTHEEAQRKLTLIFNETLEKIIESWPEHWMWFHRRWKKWE